METLYFFAAIVSAALAAAGLFVMGLTIMFAFLVLREADEAHEDEVVNELKWIFFTAIVGVLTLSVSVVLFVRALVIPGGVLTP